MVSVLLSALVEGSVSPVCGIFSKAQIENRKFYIIPTLVPHHKGNLTGFHFFIAPPLKKHNYEVKSHLVC